VKEKDPEAEDYSNIKVKRLPVVIVIVWYYMLKGPLVFWWTEKR
jgi:hypothetical protein